ncbi:MAG TPA: oxygenase MpaB family protein, partial [Mycobacterium sp.]|nr:oxygenase MpaB family protein [Mycobacterium sp.]
MTAELSEPLPATAPEFVSEGFGLADFIGEFFLLLGAGSTVLLQMAEPGVGHGVADHSLALRLP